MILDLNKEEDRNRAQVYFDKLLKDRSPVELKKINKQRTSSQNRYLHALFSIFGSELGYTIEEAKVVVKRALNYTYKRNNEWFLHHTSEMDTHELSVFIDKFRSFSSHHGIYLPSADEFNDNYVDIMRRVYFHEKI